MVKIVHDDGGDNDDDVKSFNDDGDDDDDNDNGDDDVEIKDICWIRPLATEVSFPVEKFVETSIRGLHCNKVSFISIKFIFSAVQCGEICTIVNAAVQLNIIVFAKKSYKRIALQ